MTVPPKQNHNHQAVVHLLVNGKSIIHSSFFKCLIFELLIASYYCLLVLVGMGTQNTRVAIYCLMFILNETIKIVNSLLTSIDPLGIGYIRVTLDLLSWGVKANMLYQLCVLAYLEQTLPVTLMIVHFAIANYRRSRPDILEKGRLFFKIMDFVNPILLYSFLKEFDSEQSDLSIMFLIFLCANLLGVSEIRLILLQQQSDVAGYSLSSRGNKSDFIWDRDYALKLIMIGCCIALTLKNFLLLF